MPVAILGENLWDDEVVVINDVKRRSQDLDNISFGSMEGVGGPLGCDSKEVELENRCHVLILTHDGGI